MENILYDLLWENFECTISNIQFWISQRGYDSQGMENWYRVGGWEIHEWENMLEMDAWGHVGFCYIIVFLTNGTI